MKLFDLTLNQEREVYRLILWHLAYLILIASFFTFIYYFDYFKAHALLKEDVIFGLIAPLATILFVAVSPWRGDWKRALSQVRPRVEGEPAFMAMAFFVFAFGFYIYSLLLWALGALGPALFYM